MGKIQCVASTADEKAKRRAQALKDVGVRVTLARKRLRMTKAALAKHCQIDPSSITRVEDGVQMLDLGPLVAASRALQVTIDWLLTGEGDLPAQAPAAPEDRDQRLRQA